MKDMTDKINHPSHYNLHESGIEAIEICEWLNFNLGNAFKYVFRAGFKGDIKEDLQKAIWYLKREKERKDNPHYIPSLPVPSIVLGYMEAIIHHEKDAGKSNALLCIFNSYREFSESTEYWEDMGIEEIKETIELENGKRQLLTEELRKKEGN